jgi:phosphoserine phosphatase
MSETLLFNLPTVLIPALSDTDLQRWRSTTVKSLTEAEDLLDTVESDGHRQRELIVSGSSAFVVRWR